MGHRSGLADLLVVHADGRAARATIERLSRAGLDGGVIALLAHSEVVTAGRYGDRQTDLGSSLAVGGRLVRGAMYGSPPGAVFGMVLLAVATTPTAEVLLAGAGGGALFGASIGSLTGLLTIPSMVASWERTFSPLVPGRVAVGIRIEDRRADRRARRALRSASGAEVVEVADLDDVPAGPLDPGALDG